MRTIDALDNDSSYKSNHAMMTFARACQKRCEEFTGSQNETLGRLEEALVKPSREFLADML